MLLGCDTESTVLIRAKNSDIHSAESGAQLLLHVERMQNSAADEAGAVEMMGLDLN